MKNEISPINPIIAKIWSLLPNSKLVQNNQAINGIPIICPIKIMREYEVKEIVFIMFSNFNLTGFFLNWLQR
ncbi:hypothetical protein, partial [Winogradskyella sp. UBA3174]|uniref:hypothetical protein n=1 Tax=Winogradskyella sp. UBA3174 TaxID=1947785 RepID=UPI0025FF7F69